MRAASDRSPEPFALVGSTLGEAYTIEGVLGSGAHGVVYAARHVRTGCRCALKVVHPASPVRQGALVQAVGSVLGICHPNLLPPFDVLSLPDGAVLLATQLLEGEDLANRVALQGKLTQGEGMVLARHVAAGLLALHRRGLCHGNLTPRNVFFARYDDVSRDDALGGSQGAEGIRLIDMGLGHCEGVAGSAADDQRALAILLLENIADLSLGERRVIERAQAALPQKRYPSIQEFWQALEAGTGAGQEGRSTALVPRRSRASAETAAVPTTRTASRETYVIRRDQDPAPEAVQAPRRRWLRPALIGGTLATGVLVALGIGLSQRAAEVPATQPPRVSMVPARRPTAQPAPTEVALRFVLSPPSAEVRVAGAALPTDNVLRVPRGGRGLTVVARAPGHIPYESSVVPDQDRTVEIALLPAEPPPDGEDTGRERRRSKSRRRHE